MTNFMPALMIKTRYNMQMKSYAINERSLRILKVLVERYIREGQPIGSKTLAEDALLGLSAATIRNVLADLEDAGFLSSPHTSAGRVPTTQGYRLFVNSFLTIQPLEAIKLQQFQAEVGNVEDKYELMTRASSFLSNITQLMGLVTLPKREKHILRQVEFLPLSDNRVLVILIINDYEVQNRIISGVKLYDVSELQRVGNYLTQHYAGKDLSEVRQMLLRSIQSDHRDIADMLQTVMDITEKTFDERNREQYVVAGESNLFSLAQEAGVSRLKALFEAFNQKREILELLDQCLNSQSLQIFIGEESGNSVLENCTIVTAPYCIDGEVIGALGVIGPTRMPYDQVISAVDVTAKLLSATLSEK